MVETTGQESKEFFIDDEMILIEPLRGESGLLDLTIADVQQLDGFHPFGYLKHNTDARLKRLCKDDDSDVEVFRARREDGDLQAIGVALYQLDKTTGSHEMAMVVQNSFRRTRLPYELMASLMVEAKSHGVKTVYTTDSNDNIYMRNLADKCNMSVRLDSDNLHHSIYSLSVDEHPGIIKLQERW